MNDELKHKFVILTFQTYRNFDEEWELLEKQAGKKVSKIEVENWFLDEMLGREQSKETKLSCT